MKRRRFLGQSLGIGAVLIAGSNAVTFSVLGDALSTALRDERWRLDMLGRLNAIRTEHRLPALSIDDRLNKAAQLHSDDMADRDFFDHQTPDGARMTDRADAFGYRWRLLLENIAAGQDNSAAAVDGWMHSEGHRAAILNANGRDAGMGYTFRPEDRGTVTMRHYWTLLIGTE
jgi:uncharacterized protein YkwD